MDEQQHFSLVASLMVKNQVVPFLGAGVNLCGRSSDQTFIEGRYLPSGTELAEHLASEWRMDNQSGGLARVSQNAVVLVGDGPLYNKLHAVFDHDYAPTDVHHFLATLPSYSRALGVGYPLMITANYDVLLEHAFAERGEPVDVLTYMERGRFTGRFVYTAPNGERVAVTKQSRLEFLLDERPCIVKIHGAVDRRHPENDSYVITEDDYIDYVVRAGGDLAKVFPADLLSKARLSHFLFLGYALADWNLRVILNRIEAERAGTYESWAVQLTASDLDQRAWKRRGVEVITMPLDQYVAKLRAALDVDPARRVRQ